MIGQLSITLVSNWILCVMLMVLVVVVVEETAAVVAMGRRWRRKKCIPSLQGARWRRG